MTMTMTMSPAVAGQSLPVGARERDPFDDVDDGPVRVEDHEVALPQLGDRLDDEGAAHVRGGTGVGRQLVDVERHQQSAGRCAGLGRHRRVSGLHDSEERTLVDTELDVPLLIGHHVQPEQRPVEGDRDADVGDAEVRK